MALQLAPRKPLQNLTVQGNQWQAGNVSQPPAGVTPMNVSLPAPANPRLQSSWNAPSYVPEALNFGVIGSLVKLAAADLTRNPLARATASTSFKYEQAKLHQRLKDPNTAIALTGEGGGGKLKPKVNLSNQELRMGRALGMKQKDIVAAKQNNALPQVVSTATSKMTPEELASLKPGEQMAVDQIRGAGPPSKAPPEINAAKNPYKPNIRAIEGGDYASARLAGQQLTYPIKTIAGRFGVNMKRLQGRSPEEWHNFWRLIENPKYTGSKEFEQAKYWWREGSNRTHGSAVALGTNTNYIEHYARHPWQLKDVTEEQIASGGPGILGKSAINRKHATIAEGEKAGLTLGDNPTEEGLKYLRGSANAIDRLASKKALAEADAPQQAKPRTLDLGHGHTVQLSEEGFKQARALGYYQPSAKKVVRGLRTANVALKTSILSGGQFHPVNIAALRAGPSIASAGHPIRAVKGVARTFRPLLPGGKGAVDRVITKAYQDGMIDKAAEMGMPYGEAGYNVAGTSLKSGVGHKMVFERQMPMMHDQVVRSIVHDLEKRGVSLGSEEGRQAGIAGNATMGFINKEALNISPRARQAMSDLMLAGQFTPSKVVTVSKVAKGGVAGKYARRDVASNVASALALATGVGYLVNQKSDSIKDLLLRALINPSIPTPFKDKKGNTQELRTPLTYTSEVAKILGLTLKRGKDGHLGVDWKPPTDVQNSPAYEWLRARLSPGLSDVVKVATNKTFASKPLYDPNAPFGTKAIQAATTLTQGSMPIGTQGLPYTAAVKNRLPQSARDVLEAGTPGSNPLLKSGLSSVGFTPRTDQTVGKAKDTSTYFTSVDKFKSGLDRQSKDAYDLWTGSKKNPVTGKYDIQPNVNDSRARATALLQNPKAFDALYGMNQNLIKQGQKTDPLWNASKDQISKYLQYQSMPVGGADRKHWHTQNDSWYQPLTKDRSKFFDSLPPGDPNKPNAPIEFPSATKDVSAKMDTYFSMEDRTQAAKYIASNPDLQQQFDKQAEYNNAMRKAQGYGELDSFPKASPQVQKIIDYYNRLPKNDGPKGGSKTRSLWIKSHPNEYAAMTKYFTQTSLYNLENDAGQAQFKDSGFSQKGLKAIYNLGQYDISKTKDANGNTFYALGGGDSSKYGSKSYAKSGGSAYKYAIKLSKGKVSAPKVSVKKGGIKSKKVAKVSSPKVSLKKSLV